MSASFNKYKHLSKKFCKRSVLLSFSIRAIRLFFILCGLNLLFGCTHKGNSTINWDYLIKKYSSKKQDSLFLSSIIFLKENIDDITSEKLNFYNANGDITALDLGTIKNDTILLERLKEKKVTYSSEIVKDKEFLTTEFIEKNIQMAIDSWHKYPWNKNVSQQQFLEMVLPYKVLFEYPEEWRGYFSSGKYKDYIRALLDSGYTDPNDVFYNGYLPSVEWLKYDLSRLKLSGTPSLSEILCIKKVDCAVGAHIGVYVLRSWGIPAIVDFVPFWGSKNGSHASEVFIGKYGEIQTASGRELKRAAKIFRCSFRKIDMLKKYPATTMEQIIHVLPFLSNNHISDVTKEHTGVTDIVYPIKNCGDQKIAYILVYNYGRWVPVFYGEIENEKSAIFKGMGVDMIYRVGLPGKSGVSILPGFIQIDSSGKQVSYSPDDETKISLLIKKYNGGGDAYIKKGTYYDLQILTMDGGWKKIANKPAIGDSSIIFDNVAKNGIYRVVNDHANLQLERPFSYENGEQHWW